MFEEKEEDTHTQRERERLKSVVFSINQKGVYILAEGLCFSPALKSLNISRNMRDKPTRSRNSAIEGLINLISSECPLETLILQGSKGYAVHSLLSKNCKRFPNIINQSFCTDDLILFFFFN